ncbi:hypothetical protein JHK85_021508 [Glycine max]|nr:hypothetical protein JHK85_021508 [Glycine max]
MEIQFHSGLLESSSYGLWGGQLNGRTPLKSSLPLFELQTISGPTYGVMMINIMVIASIVKWSVKLIYDPSRKYAGYPKRNIASLKPDSELRVVACLHKTHHASAVKDCLDLCCPTTEDPNCGCNASN